MRQKEHELAAAFEGVLSETCEPRVRRNLSDLASSSEQMREAYADQMRMHLLLTEHARLREVERERRGRRNSVCWAAAACLALLLFAIGTCLLARSRDEHVIRVEVEQGRGVTDEEMELCRARFLADASVACEDEGEFVKYEPGVVENPGAAIEILDVDVANVNGRHLRRGDRVWREEILLQEGTMRFGVGSNCTLTVHAPAKLAIRDDHTFDVRSGCIVFDAKRPVSLSVAGGGMVALDASVGVVAFPDKGYADLLVMDGMARVGVDAYFRPGSGVRIFEDGRLVRYRSCASTEIVRSSLREGAKVVLFNKGVGHAW